MTDTVLRLLGDPQLRAVDADGTARTVVPQPGRVSGLLSILALNAGRVVTIDRLVDELWQDNAPDTARATIHVNISRLRRQLRGTPLTIATRSPGYALEAPTGSIDLHVYVLAARRAQAAAVEGAWEDVISACEQAHELWRGEPFSTTVVPVLELERDHLSNQRQAMTELHCRALLEVGRAAEALPFARWLYEIEPYAEFGTWAVMTALHRTGRTASALEAFDAYRRAMADDLGLDPGPSVSALHLEILRAGDTMEYPVVSEVPPHDSEAHASPETDNHELNPVGSPAVDVAKTLGVVGRGRERASIEAALAGIQLQRPAVLILDGEAGMGKTMLARYGSDLAEQHGCRVVWARGVDGLAMPALSMWKRVLSQLGLERPVMGGQPLAHEAFELYDALVDRIFERVPGEGLLIVLDDIQWADDGTLQVLQLLANRMWDERLAVIATRRPRSTPLTPSGATALDRISREQVTQRLTLQPFTADDLRDVVVTERSRHALVQRSGGNPFLVHELMRSQADAREADRSTVPTGVRTIVNARVLAIPNRSRDALDAASVAGRSFELALLADMLEVDVAEVAELLQPAVDESLLVVDGPSLAWSFEHDLFREALIELQTPQQRSRLHARLADAIERIHADDLEPYLSDLALHRFEAALGQQSMTAYAACSNAADAAAAQLAFDSASQHRSRALAVLLRTPENRRRRFSCLTSLTRERRRVGDVVGAAAALDEARRVAAALEDDALTREAVVLLGGPTLWNWRQLDEVDRTSVETLDRLIEQATDQVERAELMGTLGVELYYSEERPRGVEAARTAVAIARESGDDALRARTLNNFAIAAWVPAHASERRSAIEETLELTGLPGVNEAVARLHRAALLLRQGHVGQARSDLARAEWLAPRLSLPEIEGQLASQLAGIAMLEGDETWAEDSIDRAYEILSRTSLWGGRWVRQVQRVSLARARGTLAGSLDDLLRVASEDAFRVLRLTAVLALAESGHLREARARQSRWGLTTPGRPYWNSDFDDVQAGMISALLGVPDPATSYDRLLSLRGTLAVPGTGLAVWGPVDDVLADLAERLRRRQEAVTHRRDADVLRRAVDAELIGQDAVTI